jgi:hypothetical protein
MGASSKGEEGKGGSAVGSSGEGGHSTRKHVMASSVTIFADSNERPCRQCRAFFEEGHQPPDAFDENTFRVKSRQTFSEVWSL